MKTLQLLTCSMLISGAVLLQPAQAQEQQISSRLTTTNETVVTGSSNSTFAVTLIRYEVRYSPVQRHVFLNWQTVSETNNHRFEIERSSNGQAFVKVGTMAGNPNSSSVKYYQFTDVAPMQGRSFYRLKQISTDSSFSYSNSLPVSTRLEHNPVVVVTMAPNPCEGGNCDVRISNGTAGTPTIVELLDQNSRVILSRTLPANSSATQLTGQEVAGLKGMYFLRVQSGSEVTVQRVFLK